MSNKINLIWKSDDNNDFVIGEILNSDHRYYFRYNLEDVKRAMGEGFNVLEGFPRINSKYFSEEPFKLFTSWIEEDQKVNNLTFEMFKGFTHGKFRFEGNNKDNNEKTA
ncbi:hypothetical protein [Clostridium sp.]|uniref:hypothetical protein n=1 Tax=Clostridium sp. TaxID=1506 RepID=UPI003216FC96